MLDPTRAALPRATVRLLASDGKEVRRGLTDQQGRFRFTELAGDAYTVEASLTGFETLTTKARPGEAAELVLALAPVRESVAVTATRTEVPTAQVGASLTVLQTQDIESRQELLVSELLQSVPGMMVVRTGGLGNTTSLFVRGGESDHNKVLLDGIPLNEPGGTFQFDNLTTENVERIEVVRGPQSALFGSDAIASVVQLFTKRGRPETKRPKFLGSIEGGKYDTWRGRAGLNGQVRSFDYAAHFARLATENQEANNAFRNTDLSGNFGFAVGEGTQIRLILRGANSRVGTPGQTAFGRPDRDSFFRRADGYAGISLHNQTTARWEQRLRYTFARSRQVSRNLIEDPPFTPTFGGSSAPFQFSDFPFDFLNDTRRQQVSYQTDVRAGSFDRALGQHVFTFAFDWDDESGFLQGRLFPTPPTRAERDNFGWTLQHQAIWQRFFLTTGVRVEDNDSFGTAVVPRVSTAFFVRHGDAAFGATKLKFNFGLGIKEPTLVESFSPESTFLGNPDLRPERSRSFDFGVEQRFWRDRAKIEVNWFDNIFRELIAFQAISFNPFLGSFFNVARSEAQGAELLLEIAPLTSLRVRSAYTYLDGQVVRSASPFNPVFQEGQELFRRPRHSGSLQVMWDRRRLNITSSTIFVGRRVDSDFAALDPPLSSNEGYTKWDLGWSYRSPHRLTYFGIVENLLNDDYMEALGFPALKLTYRAGVRVEF
ncbi:MAG: TonB-dependent receptor [Acidobacteria bacterium]|nr:TonB-dependent receptor [Acidobacteriota bacterium]